MNRKGVQFTLQLVEPGWWRWRFQIGEAVSTGKTQTNLMAWPLTEFIRGLTRSLEKLALRSWLASRQSALTSASGARNGHAGAFTTSPL